MNKQTDKQTNTALFLYRCVLIHFPRKKHPKVCSNRRYIIIQLILPVYVTTTPVLRKVYVYTTVPFARLQPRYSRHFLIADYEAKIQNILDILYSYDTRTS